MKLSDLLKDKNFDVYQINKDLYEPKPKEVCETARPYSSKNQDLKEYITKSAEPKL